MISWYRVRKGARVANSTKPVLVANASMTSQNAGVENVQIRLTGRGRALLKHSEHVRLTEKTSFTPTGQPATSASRSFSLRR